MSQGMDCAVFAEGLVKRFGSTIALDGVGLSVSRGEVFALLGPNGAGKTTLIGVLSTLLRPTSGEVQVMGNSVAAHPEAVRMCIAMTGQFAALDEELPGEDNLMLLAELMGFSRAQARARSRALLAGFDLEAAAGRPVREYSGGMRRRLDIAASMIT
jgi:ABC-type multidrug transport system ATPase subunit